MATPSHWIHSPAAHAALFDEIGKIAEAAPPPRKSWKKEVARTVLLGGAGVAGGYATAEGIAAAVPGLFKNMGPAEGAGSRAAAAKVILPILGASALMIGDRFRRHMDDQYRKAPGWPAKDSNAR